MRFIIILGLLLALLAAIPTDENLSPSETFVPTTPSSRPEIEYLDTLLDAQIKQSYCVANKTVSAHQYEMGVIAAELPILDFFRNSQYRKEMLQAIGDWSIIVRSYAHNYEARHGCLIISPHSCQGYTDNWYSELSEKDLLLLEAAYAETSDWILWDPLLGGPAQASYADETCDEYGKRVLSPMGKNGGYRSATTPLGRLDKDPLYVKRPARHYSKAKTGASQVGYLQALTRKEVDFIPGSGYQISDKPLDKNNAWRGWNRIERLAWYYPHFLLVTPEGVIDLASVAQRLAESDVADVPLLNPNQTTSIGSGLTGISVNNGDHPTYTCYNNVTGRSVKIHHGIQVDPRFRGVGPETALRFRIEESGVYQMALNSIRRHGQRGSYQLAAYVYGVMGEGYTSSAYIVVCDDGSQKENNPSAASFQFPAGEYLLVVDVGPTDAWPDVIPPFRWSIKKK